MFDWLFEGHWYIYTVLALLALFFLWFWWQNRTRFWLIGLTVFLALIGIYWLLDILVETGREQIQRLMKEMAAAVETVAQDKKHDTEPIFRHISDHFQVRNKDKEQFRQYVEIAFRNNWIDSLEIWNLEFPAVGSATTCQGAFNVKPYGQAFRGEYYLVRATFVLEADHQWRLSQFDVFNPYSNSNESLLPSILP